MALVIAALTLLLSLRDLVLAPEYRNRFLLKYVPDWPWYTWTIIGLLGLLFLTLEAGYRTYRSELVKSRKEQAKQLRRIRKEYREREIQANTRELLTAKRTEKQNSQVELQRAQEVISPSEPEPNLVFRDVGWLDAHDSGGVISEGKEKYHSYSRNDTNLRAYVIEVRNEFSAAKKVGYADNITAQILYKASNGSSIEVNRGAWLSSGNRISFDVNDIHWLIIALVPETREPFAFILTREYDNFKGIADIAGMLKGDLYRIEVRLISESRGVEYQKCELSLTITREPEFDVELIPIKNLTPKEIREQLEVFLTEGNELFQSFPKQTAIKPEDDEKLHNWENKIVVFMNQYPDKLSVAVFLSDFPVVQYSGVAYGPNWPSLNRFTTRLARLKETIDELRRNQ